MATTPRNIADVPPEFRAPPPSPAAGAHDGDQRSSEDDEFSGFLNRSLRVPQLILPDKIFHRAAAAPWTPPEVEFGSMDAEIVRSAARSIGCFQIVRHGIERGLIEEVGVLAGRAFRLPPEKKREVLRSGERGWGFEAAAEEEDEEAREDGEEFFWWSGRGDEELAGIWPQGHEDFRNKMQCLWEEMEKIANKIVMDLLQNNAHITKSPSSQLTTITGSSAISLHKHGQSKTHNAGRGSSLKHDILRMLIRSSICSHSICLHICRGASKFCVHSKKGSVYFPVKDDAIVVTVGDQIQTWSGAVYKHVIGKPIFQDEDQDSISIGFFYSHQTITATSSCSTSVSGEKIISLTHQIMIAACLTFLYHIIAYTYGSYGDMI